MVPSSLATFRSFDAAGNYESNSAPPRTIQGMFISSRFAPFLLTRSGEPFQRMRWFRQQTLAPMLRINCVLI